MKVKLAEATGPVLDWMVAKAEDVAVQYGAWNALWLCDTNVFGEPRCVQGDDGSTYHPSRNWSQGGPIIEREEIMFHAGESPGTVRAYLRRTGYALPGCSWNGPTPLIAAMRCSVASKLGDEVDVPEELL